MDRIVRLKDCVVLLETESGKYKIALVTSGGYRHDYPRIYKHYCDAEDAWYQKLGEVHGIYTPTQR